MRHFLGGARAVKLTCSCTEQLGVRPHDYARNFADRCYQALDVRGAIQPEQQLSCRDADAVLAEIDLQQSLLREWQDAASAEARQKMMIECELGLPYAEHMRRFPWKHHSDTPMLKTDSKIRKPTAAGGRHLSQTDALSKNDYIKQALAISERLRSEWWESHPDEKEKFDEHVSLRETVAPRKTAAKSKAAGSSRSTKKRALVDADQTDSEANATGQSKRTRMPSKPNDSPELPPHDSPEPPPHDNPEPSPDVAEPSTLSSDDMKRCTRDLKRAASTLVTNSDYNRKSCEKFYKELWTFRGQFEYAQTADQIALSLVLSWYKEVPRA